MNESNQEDRIGTIFTWKYDDPNLDDPPNIKCLLRNNILL